MTLKAGYIFINVLGIVLLVLELVCIYLFSRYGFEPQHRILKSLPAIASPLAILGVVTHGIIFDESLVHSTATLVQAGISKFAVCAMGYVAEAGLGVGMVLALYIIVRGLSKARDYYAWRILRRGGRQQGRA